MQTARDEASVGYREGVADDAASYVAYMNRIGGQSDFLSFAGGGYFLSEAQVRDLLDGLVRADNQAFFVAEHAGRIVGQMTLESSPRPRLQHTAELRMAVEQPFWGTGVARRLMTLAIDFFDANAALTRLSLEVSTQNERGIALYRKFGFDDEGVKRRALRIGDAYHDLLIMARLKPA